MNYSKEEVIQELKKAIQDVEALHETYPAKDVVAESFDKGVRTALWAMLNHFEVNV